MSRPERPTERLTIALTPDLRELIRGAVEGGEFSSASEVIRDALRQWKHFRPTSRLSPLMPVIEDLQDRLAPVCERYGVRELWAFGNSMRAGHRADLPLNSAVDLPELPGHGSDWGRLGLLQLDLECLLPVRHRLRLTVMQDINGPRQRLYTALL